MKHLRKHDTNYSPGFKCDYCSFKAKDRWHLDKHMLSHFKNTNIKNLNGPLSTFCAMNVEVSLTEFQVGDVCSSMYQMSISKAGPQNVISVDEKFDWTRAAEDIAGSFNQLGMSDCDWADWLEISCALGVSPYDSCMSWVGYSKEKDKEVFKVCIQERVYEDLNDSCMVDEFIEHLFNDVCREQLPSENWSSQEAHEICKTIVFDLADIATVNVQKSKFRCELCDKCFKDNTHLTEHIVRMHTEPTTCVICNLVYPDKHSAISHQKMCTRKCPFDHCSFQSRHKHTFMKHLRGHEKMLRRFSTCFDS